LIFIFAVNWKFGIPAGICFFAAVGLERLIKVTINRKRPFQQSGSIKMLQPVQPEDPSFPSGDCLRIWFIALLLPELLGYTGFSLAACILLGISVSLGRMVMGVHFLSDVLTGTGLGFLTAGAVIYFWQLSVY
jgi:membrane-associated phospholipid phosphatase